MMGLVQTLKLGPPEQIISSAPYDVTTTDQARRDAWRFMRQLYIEETGIEAVQIVDGSGEVVTRADVWSVVNAAPGQTELP
jgi:hypothetical protein